jgi:hypothetical protein
MSAPSRSFIEEGWEISYRMDSMETWRPLDTGARSASENMAFDKVVLELKAQERIPHTRLSPALGKVSALTC